MKKHVAMITSALIMLSATAMAATENFSVNEFRIKSNNVPHKIKVINSGLASLEERLEMLERAKESIDIEYFIYNSDKSGKLFTQALIEKARQGVKIRMLLDTFMIKSQITPFYIHELKNEGIEIKYFNNASSISLVKGMYRNHRKLLIIDGKEIITGGRNIGDEYFDLREDFNFLDREIVIEGEIVSKIKNTFEILWNSKAAEEISRPKMPDENDFKYRNNDRESSFNTQYESDLNAWKKGVQKAQDFLSEDKSNFLGDVRAKGKELLSHAYTGECQNITFDSEFPLTDKSNRSVRIIKHELFDRIKGAKEKVLFDSPYFIVDDESKNALETALNNKTQVELLTNGLNSTDAIYVFDVFKTIIKGWINKGIVAFTFKGEKPESYEVLDENIAKARFGVHAKTFVFDNKDVVIGTYNFDPRSANYNAEMIVSCDNNPELAKHVTNDIESRMDASFKLDTAEKVDESAFYKVSFFKRIVYGVLKIPANIFDYLL